MEYKMFEEQESRPMFEKQAGILGVLFLFSSKEHAALTFWKDAKSIRLLEKSKTYQQTVTKLRAAGLLKGRQTIEVFDVKGGFLMSGSAPKDFANVRFRKDRVSRRFSRLTVHD
jgi:hypothetical protein